MHKRCLAPMNSPGDDEFVNGSTFSPEQNKFSTSNGRASLYMNPNLPSVRDTMTGFPSLGTSSRITKKTQRMLKIKSAKKAARKDVEILEKEVERRKAKLAEQSIFKKIRKHMTHSKKQPATKGMGSLQMKFKSKCQSKQRRRKNHNKRISKPSINIEHEWTTVSEEGNKENKVTTPHTKSFLQSPIPSVRLSATKSSYADKTCTPKLQSICVNSPSQVKASSMHVQAKTENTNSNFKRWNLSRKEGVVPIAPFKICEDKKSQERKGQDTSDISGQHTSDVHSEVGDVSAYSSDFESSDDELLSHELITENADLIMKDTEELQSSDEEPTTPKDLAQANIPSEQPNTAEQIASGHTTPIEETITLLSHDDEPWYVYVLALLVSPFVLFGWCRRSQ